MKLRNLAIAASLVGAGLATLAVPAVAQGPMWDVVHVNLPYTVTLGDKTLQPGEYTIQQNRDPGGASRILLIYGDNGMKFETSAMSIPALDPNTARDTKVILHHIGGDYYLDKIWIEGKNYGYEFPLPGHVKDREKEQQAAVTVPARYSITQSQPATTASTPMTQPDTVAQSAPATVPVQPVTPPENTPPVTAQSTPSNPPQSTTAPDTSANSADRAVPESTPAPTSMPATSAGWLMMLISGGSLSGIGMALRRKR